MELTDAEQELLSQDELQEYRTAIAYCADEDACGPFGGWVRGHEILKRLGWIEKTRSVGHRTFIRLEKPERLTLPHNAD